MRVALAFVALAALAIGASAACAPNCAAALVGDGECNAVCDVAACDWDGGDCDTAEVKRAVFMADQETGDITIEDGLLGFFFEVEVASCTEFSAEDFKLAEAVTQNTVFNDVVNRLAANEGLTRAEVIDRVDVQVKGFCTRKDTTVMTNKRAAEQSEFVLRFVIVVKVADIAGGTAAVVALVADAGDDLCENVNADLVAGGATGVACPGSDGIVVPDQGLDFNALLGADATDGSAVCVVEGNVFTDAPSENSYQYYGGGSTSCAVQSVHSEPVAGAVVRATPFGKNAANAVAGSTNSNRDGSYALVVTCGVPFTLSFDITKAVGSKTGVTAFSAAAVKCGTNPLESAVDSDVSEMFEGGALVGGNTNGIVLFESTEAVSAGFVPEVEKAPKYASSSYKSSSSDSSSSSYSSSSYSSSSYSSSSSSSSPSSSSSSSSSSS